MFYLLQVFYSTAVALSCCIFGLNGDLLETPINLVSAERSQIRMNCRSSNITRKLQWYHRAPGHTVITTNIYNGYNLNKSIDDRYEVVTGALGHQGLQIREIKATDAGVYICQEAGTLETADAELIVLPSEPQCSTNVNVSNVAENERVTMSCSVSYAGNWSPVMSWQRDGGAVITAGVVNNTVAYKSVTYSLTVAATGNLTGTKCTCTTYFTETNRPINTTARNVPRYNFTWSSPQFTVRKNDDLLSNTQENSGYVQFGIFTACGGAALMLLIVLIVVGILCIKKKYECGCYKRDDADTGGVGYDIGDYPVIYSEVGRLEASNGYEQIDPSTRDTRKPVYTPLATPVQADALTPIQNGASQLDMPTYSNISVIHYGGSSVISPTSIVTRLS